MLYRKCPALRGDWTCCSSLSDSRRRHISSHRFWTPALRTQKRDDIKVIRHFSMGFFAKWLEQLMLKGALGGVLLTNTRDPAEVHHQFVPPMLAPGFRTVRGGLWWWRGKPQWHYWNWTACRRPMERGTWGIKTQRGGVNDRGGFPQISGILDDF